MAADLESAMMERAADWRALNVVKSGEGNGYQLSWKNADGSYRCYYGPTPADAIRAWLGMPHAIKASGAVQLVNTGERIIVTISGVQIAAGSYDNMLQVYQHASK